MSNVTSAQLRALGIAVAGNASKPRRRRTPKAKAFVDFSCRRTQRGVCITLPLQLVSEANQREHWAAKHGRKESQQALVGMLIGQAHPFPPRPLMVTFTRLGPGTLDRDNAAGCFKHVQDAIAAALGVDDGNTAAVDWDYQQEVSAAYGVRVLIERLAPAE